MEYEINKIASKSWRKMGGFFIQSSRIDFGEKKLCCCQKRKPAWIKFKSK